MPFVTHEEFNAALDRIAALEARPAASSEASTPRVYDYDGHTHALRDFDQLDAGSKAKLFADGWNGRFAWGGAVTELGLTGEAAFRINRSAHGAAIFGPGGNYGRWVFADAIGDEKITGAIAMRVDEDPAEVIAATLKRIDNDAEARALSSGMSFTPNEPVDEE